jgi:WD40 repeat protein
MRAARDASRSRSVISKMKGSQMKIFLTAFAVASLLAPFGFAQTNSFDSDVRQLREQLAEQTKRIDRIYDALGPNLAEMEERAAALKKQQAEDVLLAMKEVFRATNNSFGSKLTFIPGTRRLAIARGKSVDLFHLPDGKIETTLTGLDGAALTLAAASDGKKIFAGTQKGSVFIWQSGTNEFRKIFDWDGWPVTALAVNSDGSRVVFACNGKYGTNRAWISPGESLVAMDAASGKKLWSGKIGRGDFQAVSFSGDGKIIAVVRQGLVALLDAESGRVLRELAHEDYPSGPLSAAMSSDGKFCAAGYAPNNIGIWDAREGKCLRLLGAHSNWVVALAFTSDNSLLASSAGDSTASVWDVATGKELGRLRFGDGPAYIYNISISDDGHWLAAGRSGEFAVLEMPEKSDDAR